MAHQRKRCSTVPAYGSAQAITSRPREADADTIDLEELMHRLLSRWKPIVCLAVLLAVVMGVYTCCFVKPMYQATATIYVLSRSDSAINMADLQMGTALTSDYIKVFQMWEVHEQVISSLNLPYTYPYMRQHLSVTNDSNTRMLDITFRSPSPEEAAAVANEYAKLGSQFIADTMSTDKPNIMSVALVPSMPVGPNKTRNIILGFAAGAAMTCGLVTVQFLMDDKYKTAEDIRRFTGLATLAVIPVEDGMTGKEKKRGKNSRGQA